MRHVGEQLELDLGVPPQPIRCWCPQLGIERERAWQPPRQKTKRLAALEYAGRLIDTEGVWRIHTAVGDGEPEVFVVRTTLKYEVLEWMTGPC